MKTEQKSRSFRGTLLEIVIVVGVFSIISVYILRMFLAADHLQGEAVNTSKATVHTESFAEIWKSLQAESYEDAVTLLEQKCNMVRMNEYDSTTEEAYGIMYDGQWKEVQTNGKFLMLVLLDTAESTVMKGTVTMYGLNTTDNMIDRNKEYCSLKVAVSLAR